MNNLKQCISELQETQSASSIGQALREYSQLVKAIAKDFTDGTTVEELRAECPELSFMDDDELEDALELAKGFRGKERAERGIYRIQREDLEEVAERFDRDWQRFIITEVLRLFCQTENDNTKLEALKLTHKICQCFYDR